MVDLSTWTGMLAFAATTGIITAVLNQVFGIGRDLWAAQVKRKSEAGYLALRLAAILKGYAYACASFIADNSAAQQGPDDQYPAWSRALPDLPPFPEEKEGWHSIDLKLAGRALDLRNRLAGSQGAIDTTAQFAEDDLGYALDEHAAERGRKHGLSPRTCEAASGCLPSCRHGTSPRCWKARYKGPRRPRKSGRATKRNGSRR